MLGKRIGSRHELLSAHGCNERGREISKKNYFLGDDRIGIRESAVVFRFNPLRNDIGAPGGARVLPPFSKKGGRTYKMAMVRAKCTFTKEISDCRGKYPLKPNFQ